MSNKVRFSNSGRNRRIVTTESGLQVTIGPGETAEVTLSDHEFEAYKREQERETLRMSSGPGDHETKEMKEIRSHIASEVKKDAKEEEKEAKQEVRPHQQHQARK